MLSARSGYFSLQFMSTIATRMKTKEKGINDPILVDLNETSEVIEKLLNFIYTRITNKYTRKIKKMK